MNSKEAIARANGIEIWYETFGDRNDPPLLLIMGACCQGILWPTEFCEKLASQNFYVIRYDHRDAGFSTCFDFEKFPYTHWDMGKDAFGLLHALGIERAHIVGLSTGGSITQIMAARRPERVLSCSLIATTSDFRPVNLALQGKPAEEGALSSPLPHYLELIERFLHDPPTTFEEELEQRIEVWNALNGSKIPLERESQRLLQTEFLNRMRYRAGLNNHILANNLSEEILRDATPKIEAPTTIFMGTEDPIFPPDHGEALHSLIKGSTYYLIDGFGHVPNPHFFDFLVDKIIENKK